MNTIAGLNSVDPEVVKRLVKDLLERFPGSLSNITNEPLPFSAELALNEKYANIESLRLDDRLTID